MKRHAACLLVACLVLAVSLATHAAEPMCGQRISPDKAKMFQPLDSIVIEAVPLIAVTDPRFRVLLPSGNFWQPETQLYRGLRMKVEGCISGLDEMATVNRDTASITSRAGRITGTVKPDTLCKVTITAMDPVAEPLDLRTPRLTYGSRLTPEGNWYYDFSLQILDASGTVVQESKSGNGQDALMQIVNQVQNITVSSIIGGRAGFKGSGGNLDALVIDCDLPIPDPHLTYPFEPPFDAIAEEHKVKNASDPGFDPTHGEGDLPSYPDAIDKRHFKMAPSQNRLDLEFGTPVFVAGATYLADVSGCMNAKDKVFHAMTTTFGYAKLGQDLIAQGHCTFTIRRGTNGTSILSLPASQGITLRVYIMHDHGVSRWDHTHDSNPAVPLYVGQAAPISTSQFDNFQVTTNPVKLSARDVITSITFKGTPRNLPGAASIFQVETRGVVYSGFATGQTNTDWRMDVSGCGATLQNIAAVSTCTEGACYVALPSSSAFVLSDAQCTVVLTPQPKLKAEVYAASGQVSLILATSTNLNAGAIDPNALNYGKSVTSQYSLLMTSAAAEPPIADTPLKEIVMRGTPANDVLPTEAPGFRITLPRGLGYRIGAKLLISVSGCATYGPGEYTVPAVVDSYVPCDFTLDVPVTTAIAGKTECVLKLQPAVDTTMRILGTFNHTIAPSFSTLKKGEILDEPDYATFAISVNRPTATAPAPEATPSSGAAETTFGMCIAALAWFAAGFFL